MANFPLYPVVATPAITGRAPTVYAGGVTVFEAETSDYHQGNKLPSAAVATHTMYQALTAFQLIRNIRVAVGVVPGGVVVVGFIVISTDMDSGSPALVQSLYLGDTVVATGITTGQGGTTAFVPCVPTTLTAETPCYINTTTAAATPAAGTVYVTAVYYSA